jgi:tetratricopeptide (TPR) repeat protein
MQQPESPERWFIDPELKLLAQNVYGCYDQGNLAGAIDYLDHAIERFPQYAYLYSERANFRKLLRDYEGALSDYSQAILLEPLNALFHLWRSRIYFQIGEPQLRRTIT